MKSRSSLLAPAHPGGPGKRAIKWLWWWYFAHILTVVYLSKYLVILINACVYEIYKNACSGQLVYVKFICICMYVKMLSTVQIQ